MPPSEKVGYVRFSLSFTLEEKASHTPGVTESSGITLMMGPVLFCGVYLPIFSGLHLSYQETEVLITSCSPDPVLSLQQSSVAF